MPVLAKDILWRSLVERVYFYACIYLLFKALFRKLAYCSDIPYLRLNGLIVEDIRSIRYSYVYVSYIWMPLIFYASFYTTFPCFIFKFFDYWNFLFRTSTILSTNFLVLSSFMSPPRIVTYGNYIVKEKNFLLFILFFYAI